MKKKTIKILTFILKDKENTWFEIMCCDKCISIRHTVAKKLQNIVIIQKMPLLTSYPQPYVKIRALYVLLTNQSQVHPKGVTKAHTIGAQSRNGKHSKSHCGPQWLMLAWRLRVSHHAYFSIGLFYSNMISEYIHANQ